MLTLSGTSGDMLKATQGFVSVEFSGVGPDTHTAPSGYLPREFKEAYTLRSTTGINQFGYSLHDGECLCISCVNISSTTHGPLCSRFRTQANFKPSRHRHQRHRYRRCHCFTAIFTTAFISSTGTTATAVPAAALVAAATASYHHL